MTRAEIIKRLEEIERNRFWLAMADRWTDGIRTRDRELANEQIRLKRMLND